MITTVAAALLYIAAIYQGGQYVDGRVFADKAECIETVDYVRKSMGDDHANYSWVVCQEVTVNPIGSK
jgi:hypothetical protein